ncbi:unnamed protein product, partial [Closterium sp. NIES-53]
VLPVPLLPSVASAAAVDLVGIESVSAVSAPSERRRNGKGKRGKGTGGGAGEEVAAVEVEEGVGVGVGVVAEVGASVAAVEVEAAVAVAAGVEAVDVAAAEVELVEAVLCRGDPCSSSALVRPRRPSSFCGGLHATQRCFGRLTDAWRTQFPDASEIPCRGDLLRSGVAIFDLDFDAILTAMYGVSISDEGDCYVCVPPDLGIEAAALGASESAALGAGESALSGTTSAQVLHTFTLDSGASCSFFRDRTTLTPLSRPVAVSLADPSGGPVLAHYSTVLPCPAAPSGSLSGLYLPSFSTNLVSGADLQDAWVFPGPSLPFPQGVPLPAFPASRGGNAPLLTPPSFPRQRLRCRLSTWTYRDGEFSSDLLRAFCRLEGIRHTYTIPASPQQNGIAERRIGMVMDVA